MPFLVPAITAAATWVGATLAAGGIGAFLLRSAGTLLLTAAAQKLMPRPESASLSRAVTARQPVAPREIVYGHVRKGGVIVFLHATGSKAEHLHLVVVLAAHPVQSIGAIWFDGEEAVSAAGVALGRWSGLVSVEKALGAEDQAAFAGLMAAAPDKWTPAHRLRGVAAIHLRLSHDADAFPGGIPNITVELDGKADIYDPRTGSRGYSANAALCLADYISLPRMGLGATYDDGEEGRGGIDTGELIAAANICDESVPLAAGGVEPRYGCNGVISLGQSPKTIIEALLTAMAGSCVAQAGRWRIQVGAWRIPDLRLGPDDIRPGGLAMSTRVSMAANCNAVRGQFISPDNDWQPDDFPAVTSAAYLAEDLGEPRWRDLSLPFTTSASCAQRLARIELEQVRRQISVQVAGKFSTWAADVGGTLLLDYPRWGLAQKPFEVVSQSLSLVETDTGVALLPDLVLRETAPEVYDWSASEEQIYAAAPRTTLPSGFDIAAPGTPTVTEALYTTRDGGALKIMTTIGWTAAPSRLVASYQVEARSAGGAWAVLGQTDSLSFTHRDIAAGLWSYRVKAISGLGVSSEWRERVIEVLGLSAPPAVLTNLTLQTAGGLAILKWAKSIDADVRLGGAVIIRHSSQLPASWANSVSMDRVAGAEGLAVVPAKPGTYLLRAEDSGGRLGPVAKITTKGAQAVGFAPVSSLVADPGFVGTLTDLVVVADHLRLTTTTDSAGRPVVAASEGLFAWDLGLDFGAVRRIRLRSVIVVDALALDDLIDARVGMMDAWADFDGADGAEIDVVLEARETDDDPGGEPLWGAWGRIDSHEIEARAVQARAWLRTSDPGFSPLVSQLRIHAEEVA